MFETIAYQSSIISRKLKWNSNSFIRRYAIVCMFFVITVLAILACIKNRSTAVEIAAPMFFILTITTIYTYRKNSRLTEIILNNQAVSIKTSLHKYIEESGWEIYRSNQQYLIAHKQGFWLAGSVLIILYHKKSIFINVQNMEGPRGYSPFSFGANNKIANKFIKVIKDIDLNLA